MATQLIIYTRLEHFDYRLIYAPSKEILPEPFRSEFIDFMREVVNSDNFGSIICPRYAVIKRNNIYLIGVGCNNSILGEVTSNIERREIRGFYGIVSNEPILPSQIQIISQLNFYKDLFTQYIIPIWHTGKRDEEKINSIVAPFIINADQQLTREFVDVEMNRDTNICKIHSCLIEPCSLIQASLMCTNVDAVMNLNSEAHVTSAPLYKFHNVTISNSEKNYIISYKSPVSDESKNKGQKKYDKKTIVHKGTSRGKNDEGCLSRCVDKVEHFLSKYGINPKRFLELFAKRHHLQVVSEERTYDYTYDSLSEREPWTNKIERDESLISSEIDDFQNKRTNRRSIIGDIQAKYKEIEKTSQSSDESISNDERQNMMNLRKPLEIESIDL